MLVGKVAKTTLKWNPYNQLLTIRVDFVGPTSKFLHRLIMVNLVESCNYYLLLTIYRGDLRYSNNKCNFFYFNVALYQLCNAFVNISTLPLTFCQLHQF